METYSKNIICKHCDNVTKKHFRNIKIIDKKCSEQQNTILCMYF